MNEKEQLQIEKLTEEIRLLKRPPWKILGNWIGAFTVVGVVTASVFQFAYSDNKLTLATILEAKVQESIEVYTIELDSLKEQIATINNDLGKKESRLREADSLFRGLKENASPETIETIDRWREGEFPTTTSDYICGNELISLYLPRDSGKYFEVILATENTPRELQLDSLKNMFIWYDALDMYDVYVFIQVSCNEKVKITTNRN